MDKERSPTEALSGAAGGLADALTAVLGDVLRLLALESRLAAVSVGNMLALAVFCGFLVTSAWFFIQAAVAALLINAGLSWELILFGAALLNLVASVAVLRIIGHLSRNLEFRATRRQLGLESKKSSDVSENPLTTSDIVQS